MNPVPDGHNIILLGGWNRRIFSPAWVASHLAGDGEVSLEVAVSNPTLPLRLTFGDFSLSAGSDKLIFQTANPSDENLTHLQGLVRRVLELLPHTPIAALGINFRWLEEEPDHDLLDLFVLEDNDLLADQDAIITSTTIKRNLNFVDRVLNLSLTLSDNGSVTFDFNFHTEVRSGPVAVEAVDDPGVAVLRTHSLDLLANVYNLEPFGGNIAGP